jgi:hypothetical protein
MTCPVLQIRFGWSITIRKSLSREVRGSPPESLARIHYYSHPPPIDNDNEQNPKQYIIVATDIFMVGSTIYLII